MKISRYAALAFFMFSVFAFGVPVLAGGGPSSAMSAAGTADDWKKEFTDICSKTDDAMSLPEDELKALVDRCDKLKPVIERLDDTERRLYSKRLESCRGVFMYVLDSKETK